MGKKKRSREWQKMIQGRNERETDKEKERGRERGNIKGRRD